MYYYKYFMCSQIFPILCIETESALFSRLTVRLNTSEEFCLSGCIPMKPKATGSSYISKEFDLIPNIITKIICGH